MFNRRNCIIITSVIPAFNIEMTPSFLEMDKNFSSLLYTSLIENMSEIAAVSPDNLPSIILLVEADRHSISKDEESVFEKSNIFFDSADVSEHLNSQGAHWNTIIIKGNAIGLEIKDFTFITGKLDPDIRTVLVFSTAKGQLVAVASGALTFEELVEPIIQGFDNEQTLKYFSKYDVQLQALTKGIVIEDKEDFRKLYDFLSKKQSIPYCSQKIHEKFTEIFIEFKSLLN